MPAMPYATSFQMRPATLTSLLSMISSPCRAFAGPSLCNAFASATSVLQAQRLLREFRPCDFPSEWPYTDQDLSRLDNLADSIFYSVPKMVTHIDDRAIAALTLFYREEMEEDKHLDLLDMCSSWISYLPQDISFNRVVGLGMNSLELQANGQLTEWMVQDLNQNPKLDPLEDESFDVICNVVSVDYLIHPLQVFEEMHRILRPGGKALVSFSNRCFATKAVQMWLEAEDEMAHLNIVASYFHYSAHWDCIQAFDIIPEKLNAPTPPGIKDVLQDPSKAFNWMIAAAGIQQSNNGDPLLVVKAVK